MPVLEAGNANGTPASEKEAKLSNEGRIIPRRRARMRGARPGQPILAVGIHVRMFA